MDTRSSPTFTLVYNENICFNNIYCQEQKICLPTRPPHHNYLHHHYPPPPPPCLHPWLLPPPLGELPPLPISLQIKVKLAYLIKSQFSEDCTGLQKPRDTQSLEFQLDAKFADNFGHISRQIMCVCRQFYNMNKNGI